MGVGPTEAGKEATRASTIYAQAKGKVGCAMTVVLSASKCNSSTAKDVMESEVKWPSH